MELSDNEVSNGNFETVEALRGLFGVCHSNAMKTPMVMSINFALWFLEFED